MKNKIRQYEQEMLKIDKDLKSHELNCEILYEVKNKIKEGVKKSSIESAFLDGNNQVINK